MAMNLTILGEGFIGIITMHSVFPNMRGSRGEDFWISYFLPSYFSLSIYYCF